MPTCHRYEKEQLQAELGDVAEQLAKEEEGKSALQEAQVRAGLASGRHIVVEDLSTDYVKTGAALLESMGWRFPALSAHLFVGVVGYFYCCI